MLLKLIRHKKEEFMDLKILQRELESAGPSVVHKLYEYARKNPEKTIIYYGEDDRTVTYGEFNAATNKIARFLASTGIAKGDVVSVYLSNPFVTAMVMMGIWKAGAVFSPINFSYRGRLLSYQIKDTVPKVLVTEQARVSCLNDVKSDLPELKVILRKPKRSECDYVSDIAHIPLDKKFEQIDFDDVLKGDGGNPEEEINYWDTANIIYTSGTTGPAKGVVQSHRWIAQYTFPGRIIAHEDDVKYTDLPMYHISAACGTFGLVVWTGATLALWNRFSPSDFWTRISKSKANSATLLDVMVPWLMNAQETPQDRYNSLKWVHMQPLPTHHNTIARRFGIDFVTVGYGSTETGLPIWGCIDELGGEEGTPKELYTGHPKEYIFDRYRQFGYPVFSGTEDFKKGVMGKSVLFEPAILNERDEVLGPGEYGQIAFRSKFPFCMTTGYFNKPHATVEACRNLWFHTGDACFRDEDNVFYFADRMGNFIRVRGENVSTYQIEDILNSHPDIEVSAAFPVPAREGDEDDIVVYVTLQEGADLKEDELRKWISSEMPKFMWPKHIRFIDALPQTATNKIEKYKLKERILKELETTK